MCPDHLYIFASGFGLKRPRVVFLLAAFLLGISLWPLVMSMTEGWHTAYGLLFGSELQEQWHAKLIETTSEQVARIRLVSPWVILFSFSVIPALCEEWFFRGMLLRSLLRWNSVWKSILISAMVYVTIWFFMSGKNHSFFTDDPDKAKFYAGIIGLASLVIIAISWEDHQREMIISAILTAVSTWSYIRSSEMKV